MPSDGVIRAGEGAVRPATQSGKLRVIVFTSGPLVPVNCVFFERLATDSLLELRAIIVDEFRRSKRSAALRLLRGLREEGWAWLAFKVMSRLGALIQDIALLLFEFVHPKIGREESYEAFQRHTGVPVHRVADIHSEESLTLIKSLGPQLGAIVGSRILRDAVVTIPEYGTVNIHKRRVPQYRGGGPVGYWEVLAGEPSIGVTIHYATSNVDAGPVLRESTIPIEECDTLASLRIKADILGAQVYHEAIRGIALGSRRGVPQDASRGTTYRSPSELKVWQLQKRLERRAAERMPCLRARPSWITRARVVLQYALLLHWLLFLRKRLIKDHRAPICIFFYHMVANRSAHQMCLPLEEFVQQVEFLRRYYGVVSLEDAVKRLDSEGNDAILASITFDDGYRENTWAIEYLRYFGVPATFFVSIGHVRDGSFFAHDRRPGFREASPMREEDVQRLVADGFLVGSHGIYHEDFGKLDAPTAEHVLRESRQMISQVVGQVPEHFSFPKGQRQTNITAESFALALKWYRHIYSAYGGYNFPHRGRRHFLRRANPTDVVELVTIMDGYTGFRECVRGNAWGLKTDTLPPY